MSNNIEVEKEGYLISTDSSKIDVAVVHSYLSKDSYWAQNIPLEVVQKCIDNSLCFGVYFNNAQIGFARLITDKATVAYLADVFILSEHRGKGLNKWLMKTIHTHPVGWARFGDEQKERFMQLHNADVYKNK